MISFSIFEFSLTQYAFLVLGWWCAGLPALLWALNSLGVRLAWRVVVAVVTFLLPIFGFPVLAIVLPYALRLRSNVAKPYEGHAG